MFFHYTNFTDFLTEDQAKLNAKRCNEILNNQGFVVYGNQTEDNSCDNFSTTKTRSHTHVAFLIGVEMMGQLKPSDSKIKMEKPTAQDFDRAMMDRLRYLEAENKALKSKGV